jgi:hypothetical protein
MLVKYKKLNTVAFGNVRLIPGTNDVPQKDWEAALKLYPLVRHLVDAGEIETFDKSGNVRDDDASTPASKAQPPLEVEDLSKLAEKKAVAMVKDTVDERLLNAWYQTEKRKAVIVAIEGQFETIAKAAEPEAKA